MSNKDKLNKGTRARIWWVAILFSFLVPGLGQLYAGRATRGLVWFSLVSLWNSIVFIVTMKAMQHSFVGVWFPLTMMALTMSLMASLFIMIDAFKIARNQKEYSLKAYNSLWLYAGILIVNLLISAGVKSTLDQVIIKAYKIPTTSMSPTLQCGDFILVDKLNYSNKSPERGDLVVFKYPDNESLDYIKRVIGLPGDTLAIAGEKVHVNGLILDEPWLEKDFVELPPSAQIILDKNEYYMMGDNRNNSLDSRKFGPVKRDKIVGRAVVIYFSWDGCLPAWNVIGKLLSIRFDRIGKSL